MLSNLQVQHSRKQHRIERLGINLTNTAHLCGRLVIGWSKRLQWVKVLILND